MDRRESDFFSEAGGDFLFLAGLQSEVSLKSATSLGMAWVMGAGVRTHFLVSFSFPHHTSLKRIKDGLHFSVFGQ